MTDAAAHPWESAAPYPPRYRWLVRLAALYVVLAAAVAGVRWWWGDVAEGRFAAMVAAAHARGEKILVADYTTDEPPLPDERNAAFFIRRAQKGLNLTRTQDWALDNTADLPLREDIADIVAQVLKDRAAVLADIRRARNLERADWGVNVISPMWATLLPHLNEVRAAATFSRAAAIHAAHRGDHAAAIEHVHDILGMSRALNKDHMFLITHLVCVGVDALAADKAGQIARELQIAGAPVPPTTAPVATPATRQQVLALMAELLDDRPRRESLQDALEGERAGQVDIGQQVAKRARLIRPAIQLDVLGLAKEGEQLMAAGAAPDWPVAQKRLPNPRPIAGPRVAAHIVSQSVRPALGRAVLTSQRGAANARLAALALAIRLYQLDHHGQRPPTLAALVPAYLPAIPLDPFAAGGQPLRYVPDPMDPYIYSVGEDGIDDSAAEPPWRPDATTVVPEKAPDLFLRLTRENAPPPEVSDPPPIEEPEPTTAPGPE